MSVAFCCSYVWECAVSYPPPEECVDAGASVHFFFLFIIFYLGSIALFYIDLFTIFYQVVVDEQGDGAATTPQVDI